MLAGGGSTPDTAAGVSLAGGSAPPHTDPMVKPCHFRVGFKLQATALVAASLAALAIHADEIRLKDGKKLYGVIVAYEDNMFKVKTDFGYVLVEKDKIAQIIPSTSHGATEPTKPQAQTQPAAKPNNEIPGEGGAGGRQDHYELVS